MIPIGPKGVETAVVEPAVVDSGGQALAAPGAPGINDGTSSAGGHPVTETVATGTLQQAGLKCTFHDLDPLKMVFGFSHRAAKRSK